MCVAPLPCSLLLGALLRRACSRAASESLGLALHGHQYHRSASAASTASSSSVDAHEAEKFAAMSASWWDPSGPFAPLHRLNPARCKFIRDAVCSVRGMRSRDVPRPLLGMRALDVGCGGGILAESLARMGADVHAIDVTEANTLAARQHADLDPDVGSRVRFECISAEALLERGDRSVWRAFTFLFTSHES